MASKWVEYERVMVSSPNHPPLLEYRTMEDERVREDHRPLNGVIRPVNDDFWKGYYPPNGWGCRCTVVRLNTDPVSLRHSKADLPELPEVPKIFQTNLGQSGLVFPKNSPYFIGIPAEVKQQINSLVPDRKKD